MKDRLVECETRLAFLDDTVRTLNDAVSGHQRKIERLERALMELQGQLRIIASGDVASDDEAPPHY